MGSSRLDLKKESTHTRGGGVGGVYRRVGQGCQRTTIWGDSLPPKQPAYPVCTLATAHTSTQIFIDAALRRIGSDNVCVHGKQSQKESPLKYVTGNCCVLCQQIFNEYILLLPFPHNFVLVCLIASSVTLPSLAFILPWLPPPLPPFFPLLTSLALPHF